MNNSDKNSRSYRFGVWLTRHRNNIQRAQVFLLASIIAIFGLLFLYLLVDLVLGNIALNRAQQNQTTIVVDHQPPENITVSELVSVPFSENETHIVLILENPNPQWAASLEYELFSGGSTAGKGSVTLEPLATKAVVKRSVPYSTASPPTPTVQLQDPRWQRVNQGELPEQRWQTDLENGFSIQNIDALGSNEDGYQTVAEFTVNNLSIFGYKNVEVVLILRNASGSIQAVEGQHIQSFSSLSNKTFRFFWPNRLLRNLEPEIYINANALDDSQVIKVN